jgi:hypothetical protein
MVEVAIALSGHEEEAGPAGAPFWTRLLRKS